MTPSYPSARPAKPFRVCIQWPRFGPYHRARLQAMAQLCRDRGAELIAIETASRDATYAWDVERGAVEHERLFPSAVFEELPPRRIHAAMFSALTRLDPDAVAINSYSAADAQAALAWCRQRGRVAVLMSDSKEDDAPRTALRERVKAEIVREFDAALVGGSPHAAYLERLGFPAARIFHPYNVVDNRFFRERAAAARAEPASVRHLPGLAQPDPFFLASGRFVARKNFERLLEAYARYRASVRDPWRLVLLGDGPDRGALEDRITREGIGGVTLAGFRQIEELPAYYGLARAFVHVPLVEQWGLVVNEAMAAGLPVLVSTRAGCVPDLVHHGVHGRTFDPTSNDELARCLAWIADPATDRAAIGAAAARHVEGWSLERFAGALWSAIEAGSRASNRRFRVLPRTLLWLYRTASRDVRTFHAIRD